MFFSPSLVTQVWIGRGSNGLVRQSANCKVNGTSYVASFLEQCESIQCALSFQSEPLHSADCGCHGTVFVSL